MDNKVLLACEGKDCQYFFDKLVNKLKISEHFIIVDVKGNDDKTVFTDIINRPDYSECNIILYIRDSEYAENNVSDEIHYKSVIDTIKERFDSIGLLAPDKPLCLSESFDKKSGYIILTGNPNTNPKNDMPKSLVGTLEDLCVSIAVDSEAVLDSVKTIDFINKERNNKLNSHIHKRIFQCFLALNRNKKLVGAKSGEAVERGAYNLEHINIKPIIEFLENVEKARF
jgi:hypothetical protein